ncbi:aa3-type cytochrome c oxidase subunit IV [Novosphingobium gossypii]
MASGNDSTSVNDIKAATETYNGFIKAATWGTVVIILITAFVVGLIAS